MEIYDFLKTWYMGHILETDRKYVPWVKRYHREARIQGVIVEFEGVLSTTEHRPFLDALAALSAEPKREDLGDSLLADYQAGAIDHAHLLVGLAGHGGDSLDGAWLEGVFSKMYTPQDRALDLLRELKPRFKLGLVANSHPWHAERIVRTCPAFGLFDATAFSFEVKSMVPDRHLLNDVLDKLDLMAEECLFLTNRPDHAEAAERQLLHGCVLQDPKDVIKLLEMRVL